MNFWKTMVADRKMLTVQAAFWTIYAFILYARNVWMPEDDHKYSLGHVVGILIVILCVFYAMAWLFWMLGHSNKTIKWVIAIVASSEEHTSELQSLMRNSYAVFCFK